MFSRAYRHRPQVTDTPGKDKHSPKGPTGEVTPQREQQQEAPKHSWPDVQQPTHAEINYFQQINSPSQPSCLKCSPACRIRCQEHSGKVTAKSLHAHLLFCPYRVWCLHHILIEDPQLSWTDHCWIAWKLMKYWKMGLSGEKGVLDVSSLSSPLPESASTHTSTCASILSGGRPYASSHLLPAYIFIRPTWTLSIYWPQENKDLTTKSIWRHSCFRNSVDIKTMLLQLLLHVSHTAQTETTNSSVARPFSQQSRFLPLTLRDCKIFGFCRGESIVWNPGTLLSIPLLHENRLCSALTTTEPGFDSHWETQEAFTGDEEFQGTESVLYSNTAFLSWPLILSQNWLLRWVICFPTWKWMIAVYKLTQRIYRLLSGDNVTSFVWKLNSNLFSP